MDFWSIVRGAPSWAWDTFAAQPVNQIRDGGNMIGTELGNIIAPANPRARMFDPRNGDWGNIARGAGRQGLGSLQALGYAFGGVPGIAVGVGSGVASDLIDPMLAPTPRITAKPVSSGTVTSAVRQGQRQNVSGTVASAIQQGQYRGATSGTVSSALAAGNAAGPQKPATPAPKPPVSSAVTLDPSQVSQFAAARRGAQRQWSDLQAQLDAERRNARLDRDQAITFANQQATGANQDTASALALVGMDTSPGVLGVSQDYINAARGRAVQDAESRFAGIRGGIRQRRAQGRASFSEALAALEEAQAAALTAERRRLFGNGGM